MAIGPWTVALPSLPPIPSHGTGGIDLETGNCIDWFRTDGSVPKIYVAAISVVACPMSLGFTSHTGNKHYIVSDTVGSHSEE